MYPDSGATGVGIGCSFVDLASSRTISAGMMPSPYRNPGPTPDPSTVVRSATTWITTELGWAGADVTGQSALSQPHARRSWPAANAPSASARRCLIAAALRTSVAMGHSNLRYARAMHERLPKVGAVFQAGDIDFRLFRTIVFRTELITDADALAAVDAQLALKAPRWPSMSSWKLATEVDRVVAKIDRDAVRRSREDAADRYLDVSPMDAGMALVNGSVFATTGQALDRRLDELANTVCPDDPRTISAATASQVSAAHSSRLPCCASRSRYRSPIATRRCAAAWASARAASVIRASNAGASVSNMCSSIDEGSDINSAPKLLEPKCRE